jgi:hypothetical protein
MSSRASASTQRGGYNAMKSFLDARGRASKAAALIIVLAFVVLLTGLALAYFSSTTTDRQLAQSSYNDTSADLLARSALDIVVGDFKQEVVNGSAPTPAPPATPFYVPTSAANVVPQRNIPTPIPNLIRISVNGDPGITAPAVGSRASAVNSTSNPSANGRSISTTRWNKHCLLPVGNPSTATFDNPSPTPSFTPPDWVIVTRAGPTPFASWDATLADPTNNNYAIGRYAYAVYDEGGLLDMNVVAYPTPAATPIEFLSDLGRKGVPAWVDPTAVVPTPTPVGSPFATRLVGFRNYATTQQHDASDLNLPVPAQDANPGWFPQAAFSNFVNYVLGGFILQPHVGTTTDYGIVNPITAADGRTDQKFVTRAELINFLKTLGNTGSGISVNALQYMGTFSRERNKPSFQLTTGATGWPWSDSNRRVLPQRFYLGNLNEVVSSGNATNIQRDFGLLLEGTGGSPPCDSQVRWKYVGPSGNTPLPAIPAIPLDLTTTTLDFFQYINYALFGRTDADQTDMPYTLGIGAALIDQYDTDTLLTGIYYSAPPNPASLCDPINACSVYGVEYATNGTVLRYGDPSVQCVSALPPDSAAQGSFVPPINSATRNVGEFGWAYSILNATNNRNSSSPPKYLVDFQDPYCPPGGTCSPVNPDPALLDFFTYNSPPGGIRSGIVSLNTRQAPVLAAILTGAIYRGISQAVTNSPITSPPYQALNAANAIVTSTTAQPAMSRADIARFASVVNTPPFNTAPITQDMKDTFARVFSELTQTRTWGLLIDLVAQTGHYKPNATGLADFVVEGEKRYWLHVAIDRFDGTIVGQQLEEVTE